MNFESTQSRPRGFPRGFTLVELLVVIGIIALLIGILLPTLSRARAAGQAIKCLSNLRSLSQISVLYNNDNSGAMLPTIIWGDKGHGFHDDYWANLLIANEYVARQEDGRDYSPGQTGLDYQSILMCPSVVDYVQQDSTIDGARRLPSRVIEPETFGTPQAMTTDIAYGINGVTYRGNEPYGEFPSLVYPSSSIDWSGNESWPLKKIAAIPEASQMALLFDGKEWNVFQGDWRAPRNATRISGWRHGDWNENEPDASGKTNIAFVDGHAEAVERDSLPGIEFCENFGDASATSDTDEARAALNSFEGAIWRTDQVR